MSFDLPDSLLTLISDKRVEGYIKRIKELENEIKELKDKVDCAHKYHSSDYSSTRCINCNDVCCGECREACDKCGCCEECCTYLCDNCVKKCSSCRCVHCPTHTKVTDKDITICNYCFKHGLDN